MKKSTYPTIGIEISEGFVRVAQIRNVGNDIHLNNFGIEKIDQDVFLDGLVLKPKKLGNMINSILKKNGIKGKEASLAIDPQHTICRIVTIPYVPKNRIMLILISEVKKYAIFGGEKTVISYRVLEEFVENEQKKLRILFCATRKSIAQSYYKTVSYAGLELKKIDVSSLSLIKLLSISNVSLGNFLLIVPLASSVSTFFIKQNNIHKIRIMSQKFHGKDENLIVAEIQLMINQISLLNGEEIEKVVILLSSNPIVAFLYKSLVHRLGEKLILLKDPFSKLTIDKNKFSEEAINSLDLDFSPVISLSLDSQVKNTFNENISVNLIPPEGDIVFQVKKRAISSFVLLFVLLMVALSFSTFLNLKIKKYEDDIRILNSQINKLDAETNSLLAQKENFIKLLESLRTITDTIKNPSPEVITSILEEFELRIPKKVKLSSFNFGDNRVLVKGEAKNEKDINIFVKMLSQNEAFKNVKLGSLRADEDEQLINFDISFEVINE